MVAFFAHLLHTPTRMTGSPTSASTSAMDDRSMRPPKVRLFRSNRSSAASGAPTSTVAAAFCPA